MRDRLAYILKHNRILQRCYVLVMGAVFRLWGRLIRTDDHMILFVSYMGKGFNDSPRVLYEYIKAHPEYANYRCVWAFENPGDYPELDTVKIDTPVYFKTALAAKYWITNTNIERGLRFKKKDQRYLNTWHGVAFKHIGNDCPGRKDFSFSNVDYFCVNGDYDEKICRRALRTRPESYLRCGLPRNEELWHVSPERQAVLREALDIPAGKKVILYAPTWRDSTDGGRTYAIKPPIHFDEWRRRLGDEYVVLFRAHHQTTEVLGIQYDDFVRNMSDYPAVNDLMIASDLLITDYSTIAFDYSVLCRPILIYAYDYDTYLKDRGTYFDMKKRYPNAPCLTEEELLGRIVTLDETAERENTRKFRDTFIQYGENAAETCVRALLPAES